jgi:hypothetical protein
MNQKNNGGAAFPTLKRLDSPSHEYIADSAGGMTLRDYFAAKAPITTEDAMLACGIDASSYGMLQRQQRITVLTVLSVMRGEYADAMLVERAQ